MYTIRRVKIRVRDQTFERDLVDHPGSACVLARMGDDQYLFVRQYRPGADRTILELPGGRLRADETPTEAAAREMEAETGFRPLDLRRLAVCYVAPGYTTEAAFCFFTDSMEPGSMQFDASEELRVAFLSWAEIQAAIQRGEICDARSLLAIARYGEWMREGLKAPDKTW